MSGSDRCWSVAPGYFFTPNEGTFADYTLFTFSVSKNGAAGLRARIRKSKWMVKKLLQSTLHVHVISDFVKKVDN